MMPVILQKRGAVHLDDAAESVAAEFLLSEERGVPINPDRAVIELIPESVARENFIVPLRLQNGTLLVATANPHDLLLRDKLTFIINKPIRLIGCPRIDILRAMNRCYGRTETESVDSMLCEFTDTAIDFEDGVSKLSVARPRFSGKLKGISHAQTENICDLRSRISEDESDEFELQLNERTSDFGSRSMWFYTVEEGQRALMTRYDGRVEVIVGPRRVLRWFKRFERMRHYTAHPGEFLLVRFRDGRQEHVAGPADLWFDPRIHESIVKQDSLQLAAKEAVIVYSRQEGSNAVSRRIVYGPTLFNPAPGEWLHTFTWHGSEGGSQGARKIAKGLVFQKLWLMPDQMYHDVTDVRTADDAVLTIKLMMFFELVDIDRMLEATHDPIGDFINAATSDVVDFTGHRTFEEFKKETGKLNELDAYRQLTARAAQNGYRVTKVVYRGYGAPDRLQAMHDQAIESRTKLQLERATEEQAQDLEDFKLNAMMNRAARRRTEQTIEVETEIELARKRQEAERAHRQRDAEAADSIRRQNDDRERQHLSALKDLGVDLTQFLTQNRADRVIELRGGKGVSPHVHLDPRMAERNGA